MSVKVAAPGLIAASIILPLEIVFPSAGTMLVLPLVLLRYSCIVDASKDGQFTT